MLRLCGWIVISVIHRPGNLSSNAWLAWIVIRVEHRPGNWSSNTWMVLGLKHRSGSFPSPHLSLAVRFDIRLVCFT